MSWGATYLGEVVSISDVVWDLEFERIGFRWVSFIKIISRLIFEARALSSLIRLRMPFAFQCKILRLEIIVGY